MKIILHYLVLDCAAEHQDFWLCEGASHLFVHHVFWESNTADHLTLRFVSNWYNFEPDILPDVHIIITANVRDNLDEKTAWCYLKYHRMAMGSYKFHSKNAFLSNHN